MQSAPLQSMANSQRDKQESSQPVSGIFKLEETTDLIERQRKTLVKDAEKADTFILDAFEKTLIDKFQLLYDCFFKIIKDRLGNHLHNDDGSIDRLAYGEDSVRYLVEPKTKNSKIKLGEQRLQWLEDHLYLPSHVTNAQREKIMDSYGLKTKIVEKDMTPLLSHQFKITAHKLAEECENNLYEKVPDLKDMIRILQGFTQTEETNQDPTNLFQLIRQLTLEEDAEQLGLTQAEMEVIQQSNQKSRESLNTQRTGRNQSNSSLQQRSLSREGSSADELLSEQREKLHVQMMKKAAEAQLQKENLLQQLTKIKLRDLYQTQMLEQATVCNEFDQGEIIKWRNRVTMLEDENGGLLETLHNKNDKIKTLQEEMKTLKEKQSNYVELVKQNEYYIEQNGLMQEQIRKLRYKQKEITMNYSKEISANKIAQIQMMKQENEKYLNAETIIQFSYFDQLCGLDDDVRQLLNEKLDEVVEDCHSKIASLIKEIEKKDNQIYRFQLLSPDNYTLAQYEIHEIIQNLPTICDDIDLLWNLLLDTFGPECFTPNIVRKFPAQFKGDNMNQKEEIQKFAQNFAEQLSTIEKKAHTELATTNRELQSAQQDAEKWERLYNSVKIKNEELKIHLDSRNREFVDYRKSVNANLFPDMSVYEHIQYEVSRVRSRYETIIAEYQEKINNMASRLSQVERELKSDSHISGENEEKTKQEIQIDILEKALTQSESLTQELIKDKERIMNSCKRDAPKIYRQYQLDVFSELSVYKKKVINNLNLRLYSLTHKLERKPFKDQKEGTALQGIQQEVKIFKRDEYGNLIGLQRPKEAEVEVQTEELDEYKSIETNRQSQEDPEANKMKKKAEEDATKEKKRQVFKRRSTIQPPNLRKPEIKYIEKPRAETRNRGTQCELLEPGTKDQQTSSSPLNMKIEPPPPEFKKLLERMNKPDPRDQEYLSKGMKEHKESLKLTASLISDSEADRFKRETLENTRQEINEEFVEKAYQNAVNRIEARNSRLHKNEPDLRKSSDKSFQQAGKDLSQISPLNIKQLRPSNLATQQNTSQGRNDRNLITPQLSQSKKKSHNTSMMSNSVIAGRTLDSDQVCQDSITGEKHQVLVGLYQQKSNAFGNELHRKLPKKLSSSNSKQKRKVQSFLKQAWSQKPSEIVSNSPRQPSKSKKNTAKLSFDSNGFASGSIQGPIRPKLKDFEGNRILRTSHGTITNQEVDEGRFEPETSIVEEQHLKTGDSGSGRELIESNKSNPITLLRDSNEKNPAFVYNDTLQDAIKDQNDSDKQVDEIMYDMQPMKIHIVDSTSKDKDEEDVSKDRHGHQSSIMQQDILDHSFDKYSRTRPSFLNDRHKKELESQIKFQPLHMTSAQKVMHWNTKQMQMLTQSQLGSRSRQSSINDETRKVINSYNIGPGPNNGRLSTPIQTINMNQNYRKTSCPAVQERKYASTGDNHSMTNLGQERPLTQIRENISRMQRLRRNKARKTCNNFSTDQRYKYKMMAQQIVNHRHRSQTGSANSPTNAHISSTQETRHSTTIPEMKNRRVMQSSMIEQKSQQFFHGRKARQSSNNSDQRYVNQYAPEIKSALMMVSQDSEQVSQANQTLMMGQRNRDYLCGRHHRTDQSPPKEEDEETPHNKHMVSSILEKVQSTSKEDDFNARTVTAENQYEHDILVAADLIERSQSVLQTQ